MHIDAHPPKYGEKQGVSQALTLSQRHDMDMLHSVARNVEALKNYWILHGIWLPTSNPHWSGICIGRDCSTVGLAAWRSRSLQAEIASFCQGGFPAWHGAFGQSQAFPTLRNRGSIYFHQIIDLKISVFFLWGSTWQMSGRIGSLMPSKPWFRRSDSWLRRPSSSALAQRHLRFTEESTTRSLKVGCPATSYQHPPTTALGQFGSTC